MGHKDKSRKKKRIRPYKAIKFDYVEMPDPFGDMPLGERRAILSQISLKSRAEFDDKYPKTAAWFSSYDALYLLSHCALFYLAAPAGIDREAIEGKLDFASFHLELLQAFALTKSRCASKELLGDRADELKKHIQDVGEALKFADMDFPADLSEVESRKRMVMHRMRDQTFAVRHWAYPDQILAHLKDLFSGPLSGLIAADYRGVSIPRLVDAVAQVAAQTEDRMNVYLDQMRSIWFAKDFEGTVASFKKAFPESRWTVDQLREALSTDCEGNLQKLKSGLMTNAEAWLSDIYSFKLEEVVSAYGEDCPIEAMLNILRRWSLKFGDLAQAEPRHFLYSNPILAQPLIQLTDDGFFWALSGIFAHTLPAMLDLLIAQDEWSRYSAIRSKYLENRVAELFTQKFPKAKIYCGSKFRIRPDDPAEYENDILVIVDTTAFVIECKSGRVAAPARRGAPSRLTETLDDLIAAASTQARRFTDFLRSHPRQHSFQTKSGKTNNVDASRILRFIPLSITYENLGFISANLKELAAGGFIEAEDASVCSICFTDLELIFDILDSQAQRIHYLARRTEIERTMNYLGDEIDLLAFYVETGFNVGEMETTGFLNMVLKSKELDPYYVGLSDGVSVPKPRLRLTDWWRKTLSRLEEVQTECWTEVSYVFLSVAYADQIKFDQQTRELIKRIKSGGLKHRYNWAAMLSGTNTKRRYAVIGFPYSRIEPDERAKMMRAIAGDFLHDAKVSGLVVLAFDIADRARPYAALMYVPGNAQSAINVGRLLPAHRGYDDGFDFHLKSPRPRRP